LKSLTESVKRAIQTTAAEEDMPNWLHTQLHAGINDSLVGWLLMEGGEN
jgi:hypothetical protein